MYYGGGFKVENISKIIMELNLFAGLALCGSLLFLLVRFGPRTFVSL